VFSNPSSDLDLFHSLTSEILPLIEITMRVERVKLTKQNVRLSDTIEILRATKLYSTIRRHREINLLLITRTLLLHEDSDIARVSELHAKVWLCTLPVYTKSKEN